MEQEKLQQILQDLHTWDKAAHTKLNLSRSVLAV